MYKQLLIIIFVITSCKNLNKDPFVRSDLKVVHKIDTAEVEKYNVSSFPEIFETSFFKGTKAQIDSLDVIFYPVTLGEINLSSGKVIACDPVMMYRQEAFTTKFPVGLFPVQLALATYNENETVAFARILFSEKPVVKWEFALLKDQEPLPIGGDDMYGYGVDGGLGQFIDEKIYNDFDKLDTIYQSKIMDSLIKQLTINTRYSWQYANISYYNINLIAFTSGLGDGHYATYVGYDKDDKPCRLLTDFGLLQWAKNKL